MVTFVLGSLGSRHVDVVGVLKEFPLNRGE